MKTNPDRTPKRICRQTAALAVAGLISLILAAPGTALGESQTWNTFLGGAGWDTGRGAAVDADGNVYVSGTADGIWGVPGRAYTLKNDVFVANTDRTGAALWECAQQWVQRRAIRRGHRPPYGHLSGGAHQLPV